MAQSTAHPSDEPGRHSSAQLIHALSQFLRVLRNRVGILATCMIVSLLLGALYYFTATRYYRANASLLILQSGDEVSKSTQISSQQDGREGLMPTYQRLLSSAAVLNAAATQLSPKDRIDLAHVPQRDWADALRENLGASTVRQTNIIEVNYRSRSPEAAVSVVRAVVDSYLQFMDRTHKGSAREINEVFVREKTQLEEKLRKKEQELIAARTYFKDLGLANTAELHPLAKRAILLNEALAKTQEERLEYQSMLASVETAIRKGADLQQHVLSLEESVGRAYVMAYVGIGDDAAGSRAHLQRTLLADKAELKSLEEYFGINYPAVVQIRDRIHRTEDYLHHFHERTRQRLDGLRDTQLGPMLMAMVRQKLAESWEREKSLGAAFEQAREDAVAVKGDMSKVEVLEHDVKWLRKLREVLLDRITNIDLSEEHGTIRAAVIDDPVASPVPVSPKLTLVLLICLAAGAASGVAIVYVLDTLDDRFRSPEELRSQLGIPILAMIRQLDGVGDEGIEGVQVHRDPEAVESEAFRTLRTALALSGTDASRIVVSSAEPSDGKTTVLVNLAVAYAQAGRRTLIIDADLRRPGLTQLLGLKGEGGLSDVLRDGESIEEKVAALVRPLPVERLHVLPAGPRRPNPSELLAAGAMGDLLAWAEGHYDQVLIDSPPTLAASDASIAGRLVDGVILVVRPDTNRRNTVVRAVESFTSLDIPLLGVVLNRIDSKGSGYYGYGYGYGYGAGYGEGYGHAGGDPGQEGLSPLADDAHDAQTEAGEQDPLPATTQHPTMTQPRPVRQRPRAA